MSTNAATGNPSVEDVEKFNADQLETFLREKDLKLNEADFGILRGQDVVGSVFVELTYERLVNYPFKISGGKATKLAKVIKDLNSQKKSVAARSPDNFVYIFIDHSNLFIEGSKIVARLEEVNFNNNKHDFYVDHGLLVTTVSDGRKVGGTFIVGSTPPNNDTLWRRARSHGFKVKTYKRNAANKEKKVDTTLACDVMEIVLTKSPGTILLVAGDGDYCPPMEKAKKKNWKIETWFWDGSRLPKFSTGMSSELKSISSYRSLDDYYKCFTYIIGPSTNREFILEIDDNIIKNWPNETLMECFCELGLFGRWKWANYATVHLYFKNYKQLQNAKSLLSRKHPGISFWDPYFNKYPLKRN